MEKGEILGKGRTAEVIYWGNDKVLKLFFKDIPSDLIDYQFKVDTDDISTLDAVFDLAEKFLDEEEIFASIQQWIREDQTGFLVNTLVQPNSSLDEILSALDRYTLLAD